MAMGEKYASPHKIYFRVAEFINFSKDKGVWGNWVKPGFLMGIKEIIILFALNG